MTDAPKKDTRKNARYTVFIDCALEVGDHSEESQISNLSLGGALVTSEERLALGTEVTINFRIPDTEASISAVALVRWQSGTQLGVQFNGLRAREVWSLSEYFKTLDA